MLSFMFYFTCVFHFLVSLLSLSEQSYLSSSTSIIVGAAVFTMAASKAAALKESDSMICVRASRMPKKRLAILLVFRAAFRDFFAQVRETKPNVFQLCIWEPRWRMTVASASTRKSITRRTEGTLFSLFPNKSYGALNSHSG